MSHSSFFGIDSNGDVSITLGKYNNSWLSGPLVWTYFVRKYMEKEWKQYSRKMMRGKPIEEAVIPIHDSEFMNQFWPLFRRPELENFERIVLLSTYDRVWAKSERFEELLVAFREFEKASELMGLETHIGRYADDLDKNMELIGDQMIGCCWHITSIVSNPWEVFDEATEEFLFYNVKTGDNGHWELFDDCLTPALEDLLRQEDDKD